MPERVGSGTLGVASADPGEAVGVRGSVVSVTAPGERDVRLRPVDGKEVINLIRDD
jgi:hypothetical protein